MPQTRDFARAGRRALPLLLVLIHAIPVALPGAARAGAWARERGEAYVKASVSALHAEEMYDAQGSVRPLLDPVLYENTEYGELGAALYAEYGLLPALTLIASLPVKVAQQEADGRFGAGGIYGQELGFGDARLGARLPLHRRGWAAALESDLKVPLYDNPRVQTSAPMLGSGFVDAGAGLSLGLGLPSIRGYGQGTVGYRIRGGGTPEELYWDLEAGLELARALRLRLRFDAVDSDRAGQASTPGGTTGTAVPNAGGQDFSRIAPTLAVAAGNDLEISITWRRILSGRSAIRSQEWEVAVTFLGGFLPSAAGAP